MTIPPIIVRIIGDDADVKRALRGTEAAVANIAGEFARIGSRLSIGVTLPIVAAAGVVTKLGSDAQETGAKFDAVFKQMANETRAFAGDLGDAIGRSRSELEAMLASFQDTFVPLGFARRQAAELSKEMAKLVLDVAAFNNKSDAETARNFGSALVGNHEAVRGYGIAITQARLDQELLRQGLTGGALAATEQEKVLARLSIITRSSADAAGIAAAESGSFAGELRSVRAAAIDLGEAIADELLPAATAGLRAATRFLDALGDANPNTIRWAIALAGVAAAAGPVIVGLSGVATAAATLRTALSIGLLPLIGIGGGVALGLGAIAALLIKVGLDAAAATESLKEFADAAKDLDANELAAQMRTLEAEHARLSRRWGELTETISRMPEGQTGRGTLTAIRDNIGEELLAVHERLRVLRAQGETLQTLDPIITDVKSLAEETARAAEAAQRLVDRFREAREADFVKTRRELREVISAATLVGDQDALRQANRELGELERQLRAIDEIRPAVGALADSFARIGTVRTDAGAELERIRDRFESTIADMRENLQRGILSDEEFQQAERAAVDAFNQNLLRLLNSLRQAGAISADVQKLITDAFVSVPDESAESFESISRKIEEAGRGALQLAEAMGIVDDEASRALQSAIQLAAAIPGALAGEPTSILSGLGALVSLLSGDSEAKRIAQQNTAALERLTSGVARLGSQLLSTAGADIAGISSAAQAAAALVSGAGPSVARDSIASNRFRQELARLGLTMEDAENLARAFGITLDGSTRSIEAFGQALQQFQFEQLFTSFAGQLRLLQAEFELFDITEPLEQLRRTRELFLEAVNLGPDLEAMIAGIDLSTAGGQAAFEKVLQDLFSGFGELSPEALGTLSPEDFLAILRSMEGLSDSLDGLAESARDAAGALLNLPQGFRIDLARFNATQGVVVDAGAAAGAGITVNGDIVLVDPDPARLNRQITREAVRTGRRGGATGWEFVR